jgi:hypothetical protein
LRNVGAVMDTLVSQHRGVIPDLLDKGGIVHAGFTQLRVLGAVA